MRTTKQIESWVGKLSDRMLRKLLDIVYQEGVKRGFGTFWHE